MAAAVGDVLWMVRHRPGGFIEPGTILHEEHSVARCFVDRTRVVGRGTARGGPPNIAGRRSHHDRIDRPCAIRRCNTVDVPIHLFVQYCFANRPKKIPDRRSVANDPATVRRRTFSRDRIVQNRFRRRADIRLRCFRRRFGHGVSAIYRCRRSAADSSVSFNDKIL